MTKSKIIHGLRETRDKYSKPKRRAPLTLRRHTWLRSEDVCMWRSDSSAKRRWSPVHEFTATLTEYSCPLACLLVNSKVDRLWRLAESCRSQEAVRVAQMTIGFDESGEMIASHQAILSQYDATSAEYVDGIDGLERRRNSHAHRTTGSAPRKIKKTRNFFVHYTR